jgi:hydrogenase/urease accessory protein HupE
MTSASSAATAPARSAAVAVTLMACLALASTAAAHAVTEGDKGYIQEMSGMQLVPFLYLGAKHMVTGFDHLLFLFGVIFFLYRMKDVALYVSLFAVGHSTTMILGVLRACLRRGFPG